MPFNFRSPDLASAKVRHSPSLNVLGLRLSLYCCSVQDCFRSLCSVSYCTCVSLNQCSLSRVVATPQVRTPNMRRSVSLCVCRKCTVRQHVFWSYMQLLQFAVLGAGCTPQWACNHRSIQHQRLHQISLSAVSSPNAVATANTLHVLHACLKSLSFAAMTQEPVSIAVSSCGHKHLPYPWSATDFQTSKHSQLTGMQLEPPWSCESCKLVVALVKICFIFVCSCR